jgi:hypothetical protein
VTERLQRPSRIFRSQSHDNGGVVVEITLSECNVINFVRSPNGSDRRRFCPLVRRLYGVVHDL